MGEEEKIYVPVKINVPSIITPKAQVSQISDLSISMRTLPTQIRAIQQFLEAFKFYRSFLV